MPEHLEEIAIAIDKGLEAWELAHKDEYADTLSHPARLEKCVATGQQDILKKQRETVVMTQFPSVCCSQMLE